MQRQYATNVKLPTIIALGLLLFGLLSWVIIEVQTSKLSNQRITEKSHATLSQLSELIRTPLFSSDIVAVQFTLRNATKALLLIWKHLSATFSLKTLSQAPW
jgi:hypothetical protein